jgi:hypothetical protein
MLSILTEKDIFRQIKYMESRHFSLGPSEKHMTVRIISILFGLVCIAIAVFWMIFNIKSARADRTLWITVLFLTGFGLYQMWSGFGGTRRFIEIGNERIVLRKNSLLPRREMISSQISKIKIHPLNIVFYFAGGGKTILRFGTEYADRIEPVKAGIEEFAVRNKIDIEEINDEI